MEASMFKIVRPYGGGLNHIEWRIQDSTERIDPNFDRVERRLTTRNGYFQSLRQLVSDEDDCFVSPRWGI